MVKTKTELLEEATALGLELTAKNTIAEITAAINETQATSKTSSATVASVSDISTPDAELKEDKAIKSTAKAGKRSEKAQRETIEKIEKETRKETGDTTPLDDDIEATVKKGPKPVTRPLIERRGKKFRELAKKIETGKKYSLAEALQLATETSPAAFDASIEVHVVLGVDPRQADQNIRATINLPHGTGKKIRVVALVGEADTKAALEAGADIAGEEKVLEMLDKQQLDFDILVTTPQFMPKLGKYARTLGPRGLMPNPKSGTVATNPAQAVKEAKGGRIEYRVDKQAIVHLAVGKVSFGQVKLADNVKVFFDNLSSIKPNTVKGSFIKSVSISTTMGPGITVDATTL